MISARGRERKKTMTIMDGASTGDDPKREDEAKAPEPEKTDAAKEKEEATFTGDGLSHETTVQPDEIRMEPTLSMNSNDRPVTISAEDKVAFLDSVVTNARFEKTYRLFGGKISLKVRSLTADESQAIASWVLRHGADNPGDQIAGRFLKHVLAAQISFYNGVAMPPMAEPLYETLDKDGKTVTPVGWLNQGDFWDKQPSGVVQAVRGCLNSFDRLYAALCSKAEDENFWNPDTP